jgi:cell wall-associated NlpC family hydrolase
VIGVVAPWAKDYIGLPYAPNGRTREGLDCWGLLALVLREQYAIPLESHVGEYNLAGSRRRAVVDIGRVIAAESAHWQEVPRAEAQLGDGLVLRIASHPLHVGVVAGLDPLRMLHVEQGLNAVLERVDSVMWAARLDGIFRWRRA